MTVEYAHRAGSTFVRAICDGCGTSASSDTLTDDELCALIGWTSDFGAILCVLCQRERGMTPSFARRFA